MSSDNSTRLSRDFQPKTLREVFVLQLAQRLQDEEDLGRYLDLLSTHTVPFLLDVYQAAKEETTTPEALRERFWILLRDRADEGSGE
jgi:hypothetical protein